MGLDAGRGEGGGGLADINLTHEFCCQRYFQLPFEVKTLAITLFNIYTVDWISICLNYILHSRGIGSSFVTLSCTDKFTISSC